MRILLVIHDDGLRMLRIPGEPAIVDTIPVHSPAEGVRLLSAWQHDAASMANLRAALAADDAHLPATLNHHDAIQLAADRMSTHRLGLIRFNRLRRSVIEAGPDEAPPPPSDKKKKALTWIEILAINDLTGDPIPWVRIQLTLPDGTKEFFTTDKDGLIRVEDIDAGTCDARCELDNATNSDTFSFVAMGAKTDKPKFPKDSLPSNSSAKRIANVEWHKVKKGETIDSLAKKAGMTWQKLSYFNWGVTNPDDINDALRDEVGCTKKTKNKLNYVFDDSDKPGIVFIPTKWEETGLATGKQHIVRAKPILRFLLLLRNELELPIPEATYQATLSDDSKVSGKLGVGGMDHLVEPIPGPLDVLYDDHTDILQKSLAAIAHDAFARRDVQETMRILKHDPKTVKGMIDAYAKYFDDVSGKGFINDAYEEVTDPEALERLETLMLMAGLEVRSGKKLTEASPPDAKYDEDGVTAPTPAPPAYPSLPPPEVPHA